MGIANWLLSRTHPLIHLQLGSPFLKPRSAGQCLKELSSALETALGIGESWWLIYGRELQLEAEGRLYAQTTSLRHQASVFLLEASRCLSGPHCHRHMSRNPVWVLLGLVCLAKLEEGNAGATSQHILLLQKRERLRFAWICSETKGRSVSQKKCVPN